MGVIIFIASGGTSAHKSEWRWFATKASVGEKMGSCTGGESWLTIVLSDGRGGEAIFLGYARVLRDPVGIEFPSVDPP